MSTSELVKEIRGGATFKTFRQVFEAVTKRVDIAKNTAEVLGLHTSRTSRSLATKKERYSPSVLIDASLNDLSARARMVELRVRADLNLSTLREAVAAFAKHVQTEYAEELREFRTAEQRKALVDRVIKQAREFMAEGETFIATVDTLVKDIDQSGHSLRHVIECLKLLDGNKGSRTL
jgi:hypothetical protein